ncbi:MAG: hypothetical protein E7554_05255 [Ruminococcaceae bacterium]|nr:hypothetical protein [Oscillospiraceae bacterium]
MAKKEKHTKKERKWYRLDNAATIYPVMSNRSWMAMFRLCATLTEEVDKDILEEALRSTVTRFPTMTVRVRRGFFWHYLEHVDGIPPVTLDVANPCLPVNKKENNGFLFRVRYYKCRIALEFFHVLTDGSGGMCFLKTLVAEYLRLRYGTDVPRGATIMDCSQPPRPEELEDSFPKFSGKVPLARGESKAYHLKGTKEHKEFMNITTGIIDSAAVARKAKEIGVSVTHYLCAVLIQSIADIQRKDRRRGPRKKPIKICVPVNLRRIFGSSTVRNFSSYVNPGIERKYGEYSLAETAKIVQHQMGLETTPQHLRAKFTANVQAETNPLIRMVPLFVKIMILQIVYRATGDVQTTSTISNLGIVNLPEEMENHVERLDFQLGPLFQNKVTCAAVSYKDKLYINFTRKLRESDVERGFFTRLVEEGIPVTIESNMSERSLME